MRLFAALVVLAATACDGGTAAVKDAAAGPPLDAPVHDPGPGGGIVDELRFGVVGDTRPANVDDTANYPTAIVRELWTELEAEQPHVPFAVTTGDYMFASASTGTQVAPQLDLYLGARQAFSGYVYPAMGNHECNGYTASNCGPGGTSGSPQNYKQFMDRMITPLGEQAPYYVERFAARDGSWSAKFVFIAANAWNATQAAWLDRVLGEPTTYTFAVRHEQHDADTAPGVGPSATILARHPLTMLIVGHSHTYRHVPAYREIIVGNGGAPLTTATNYGYVVVARQPDATLKVTSYEYMTHAVVDQFAVTATGVAP